MNLPAFDYLLLKVAMRCNINCTYCYWFRDNSVYDKPKILTENAEKALLSKLEAHVNKYSLDKFSILLHGGEPLLFGKARMSNFFDKLRAITQNTGCDFELSTTTNALLIDEEWISLFKKYSVDVSISIDGPPKVNDKYRVDFKGNGTSKGIERSLKLMTDNGFNPGVLSVCDPKSNPEEVVKYLVEELKIKKFDILVPDATHEDNPEPISKYFVDLFDLWYFKYSKEDVDIRYPKAMLKGLLGGVSKVESIGYGPINTVCMLTDGSLEPLDVIRISGNNSTATELNIFDNTFQDLTSNPLWESVYNASLNLSDTCKKCDYVQACGGGFLPHRYSKENLFDNPSVYCDDLKIIFSHIWNTVSPNLQIETENKVFAIPSK